jgi:RNA polymerase sigma-70 factor (ECF subfamily)
MLAEVIDMPPTSVPPGFASLYQQHYEAVFRAAVRITGNRADAEDVLQTVFLRVLAQGGPGRLAEAPQGEPDGNRPAAYFRRAAVNAAVDVLRRRAARPEAPYDEATLDAPAGGAPVLLKEQLRRALATLDRDDAALFLLRYVEGLSNDELAGLFRLEKNNVAVRLHRIRLRLQAELAR